MAFNFIKKVFSFGSNQVEETKDGAAVETPAPTEQAALPAPEDMPVAEPVAELPPEPQPVEIPAEPVVAPPQPEPVPPEDVPEPSPQPPAAVEARPAEPALVAVAPVHPVPPPAEAAAAKPAPKGGIRKMFDRLLGKDEVEHKPAVEPAPDTKAPLQPEPAAPESAAPEPVRPEVKPEPVVEAKPEPEIKPEPVAEASPPFSQPEPEIVTRPEPQAPPAPVEAETARITPLDPPPADPEPAPEPVVEPSPAVPLEAEIAPEPPVVEPPPLPPVAEAPVAPPAPEPPKPASGKVTVTKSVEAKAEAVAPAPAPKQSWFQRMRAGLSRSSQQLSASITGVFTKKKLDEDTLQDLEDVLIRADLGVETALRVTDTLAATRLGRDISDAEVRGVMATEIEKVLKPVAMPLELDLSHKPHVILVVGVNGTGKTTTIGKLAAKLSQGGLNVMLAAGDTFRAAAIEQLKIWGERTTSPVVSSKLGADAAGLAYDAFEQAKEAGSDVLIIDTAGRLQNKAELMAELEKIVRVLGKLDPEAPHTVLQTVDATTGQNALNQVEIFRNVAGVNGLVMTKLDGTARGGILVAIAAKHKLPVYFIGVGEQVDDLEPFSANEFARAIAGVA